MTTEATPHSNDRGGGGAVTGIDIKFVRIRSELQVWAFYQNNLDFWRESYVEDSLLQVPTNYTNSSNSILEKCQ